MKKLLFKRKHCLKPKNRNHYTYIKDRAIKKFLLQHMRPQNIDFSQVKNCFLLQMENEENIFEKLFPDMAKQTNEVNTKLNDNSSLFRCPNIFEKKF